jgi:hypothetical protein
MAQTMNASYMPATEAPRAKSAEGSFFNRLYKAILESRRVAAEREIRRHRHVIEQLRLHAEDLPFGRL